MKSGSLRFPFLILLSALFHVSWCQGECTGVTCPKPLDCHPPKSAVVLPDPENVCCNITECVCFGTTSRVSQSGSDSNHYDRFVNRYTNCTLVEGNLEITNMKASIGVDVLDATKHIRAVTGHVLIAMNSIRHIDLSSLRLIRGKTLYAEGQSHAQSCNFIAPDENKGYALFMYSNPDGTNVKGGLETVDMRSLAEISRGNVSITSSPNLCYMDTIAWEEDVFNNHQTKSIPKQKAFITLTKANCPKCSNSCITNETGNVARCWGPGRDMCQQYTRMPCVYCGPGNRCSSTKTCCQSYCAGGCSLQSRCYFCDKLSNFGDCVETCPNGEVRNSAGVIASIDQDEVRYRVSFYCVKKCPDNLRLLEVSKTCVATCPQNHHEKNGTCKKCENNECANICYGLDMDLGDLRQNEIIHSGNIGNFSKNCTIIKGSLMFRRASFEGDSHCNISAMDQSMLDVFENVEVITGSLTINHWPRRDLCVFKNLKKIEGLRKKLDDQFSFIVMTNEENLHQLCLNSLEEISSGSVSVSGNPQLCAADINWSKYIISGLEPVLSGNKDKNRCRPCHRNCKMEDGCWGYRNDQCVTCKNFTDYTNNEGKFASKWTKDSVSGKLVPGHNVTKCVKQCKSSKGVYATDDMKCYPCHEQCNNTCSGGSPSNCTARGGSLYAHGCKNAYLDGVCVEKCPMSHYKDTKNVCQKCDAGCIDGTCTGPERKYGDNGCSQCYREYNIDSGLVVYNAHTCSACLDNLKDESCTKGCTYHNATGVYECIDDSQPIYVWLVPLIIIISVLLVVIAVIRFKCKKTIKTMRDHISEKIVADPFVVNEFDSPVTPSGTAPNTNRLRIVAEKELTIGKELGAGAFGAVFKAVWTYAFTEGHNVKIPVAVKQLKTFSNSNEIMEEAHVMASVDSPYLVRLLGMCLSGKVSLITQLMPLGSLLDYVRDNSDSIGSRHMLTWCMQIAKGMKYLEDKHLVHRDLAARNVLVKTPHHVKITDFGLSKMLNASESFYLAEGGKLPIKWLAIECINERKFSHQSDVWSFGITCWEIFTFGARPYEGECASDVPSLLRRGERLVQPAICTLDVYMILVKCWLVDPLSRPKFSELEDEFRRMSNDYSRYLLIKDDNTTNLLSPNPEEEKQFFERLIQEDNDGIDHELALDDPDNYLLRSGANGVHEYENQPLLRQTSNHESVGGPPRDLRLFSRNTPSAGMPTPQPQNTTDGFPRSHSRARDSESSGTDDVFANSGHGVPGRKAPLAVDVTIPEKPTNAQLRINNQASSVLFLPGRKDSEESSRYTEDPTTHNRNSYVDPATMDVDARSGGRHDNMLYDEEEYLLPTPSMRDDYMGGKKSALETQPKLPGESAANTGMSLSNNVYMDDSELAKSQQTHPSSWPNQFLSRDNANDDPIYINDQQPEHDYLNWNGQEDDNDEKTALVDQQDRQDSPTLSKTPDDASVEYLNPSNIIHDHGDNLHPSVSNGSPNLDPHNLNPRQSPTHNGDGPFRNQLKQNGRTNVDETDRLGPQFSPMFEDHDSHSQGTPTNIITGLDNPEYMMLQECDGLLNGDSSEA